MSTRSLIGIQNANKTVEYIYCHHDGYLEWVGNKLITHYKNEETIRELLALGDLSSLGNKPISSPDAWEVFSPSTSAECLSYKMRGETDVDTRTTNNLDTYFQAGINSGAEYLYVYVIAEKEWKYRYIYDNKPWRSVQESLHVN